jgi:hypothetical protein
VSFDPGLENTTYSLFHWQGTKKTKPKTYKYNKAQHKNELHQELLPAAAQPAPPPLRHHRVCQACRVHLENFQGLLRKATPLRPQPLCGDANLLDVKTFLKLLKNFKKNFGKKLSFDPGGGKKLSFFLGL